MQRFRVLIRPVRVSGDLFFVAQCLEKNIAVQGDRPQAALRAFMDHLVQVQTLVRENGAKDPFSHVGEAPSEAWRAFDEAFKGKTTTLNGSDEILVEPALSYAS